LAGSFALSEPLFSKGAEAQSLQADEATGIGLRVHIVFFERDGGLVIQTK
jgi:hypothetical protein